MLTSKRTALSMIIQAALITGIAAPVYAADVAADQQQVSGDTKTDPTKADQKDAEVIEVTGSGRIQSARDVPMNISAINEEDLRQQNITDIKGLLANLAEINAPANGARFADSVTVRGLNVSPVNANNLEQFTRSTLAYYLDDTPLPNIAYRIKDVERVETLMGPQGTLYGAGSLGGTVRYITNAPQLGVKEFKLNTNFYQTKNGGLSDDTDVVINLPFGDNFAVRTNLSYLDEKGYTDRISNPVWRTGQNGALPTWSGNPDENKDLYANDDWQRVDSGRVSLLWQASDRVAFKLSHIQQTQLAHGTPGVSLLPVSEYCQGNSVCEDNTSSYDTPYQVNDHTIQSRYEEYADRDFILDSLDFDVAFGSVTLHSSTSTFEDKRRGQADYAHYGEAYYGSWIGDLSIYNPANDQSAYMTFDNTYEGVSHETRLTSTHEGPLQWIAGFYYTKQERHYTYSEWLPTLDQVLTDSGLWFGLTRDDVGGRIDEGYYEDLGSDYKETALFGEIGYDVTERWNVTVGVRAFNYQDVGISYLRDYAGDLVNSDARARSDKQSDTFYKFNTSFKFTDDVLGYATYSQGFRRGGTNGFKDVDGNQVAANVQNYTPDSIDNSEIGLKSTFFDRALYVQANFYQMKWHDAQTYYSQDIPDQYGFGVMFPINGTTNGPDALTRGFELQARWRISEGLSFRVASATTKAEWDSSKTLCTYADLPDDQNDCRSWNKGGDLGGAPKWKHTMGLDYSTSLASGHNVWASLSGRHVGKVQNDRQDDASEVVREFDAYTQYDASLGFGKNDWEINLWVQNLSDENAIVSSQFGGDLGRRLIMLQPRTVGVTYSYRFAE